MCTQQHVSAHDFVVVYFCRSLRSVVVRVDHVYLRMWAVSMVFVCTYVRTYGGNCCASPWACDRRCSFCVVPCVLRRVRTYVSGPMGGPVQCQTRSFEGAPRQRHIPDLRATHQTHITIPRFLSDGSVANLRTLRVMSCGTSPKSSCLRTYVSETGRLTPVRGYKSSRISLRPLAHLTVGHSLGIRGIESS